MDLFGIVLYSALKKHFFDLLFNIKCLPGDYVGCTNVDRYFDIERVGRQELIDVGLGVKISKPVEVERDLNVGSNIFSSLSHNGVLAIYSYESEHKYQLTDLVNERQIEIKVEKTTHTGFYDDSMVMLTCGMQLGVCLVEDMFSNKSECVLKRIGDVKAFPFADVSLLHSTRALVFTSALFIPHEFNVDSGMTRELNIMNVWSFASLMGIDIGVKGVFMENGNSDFTYSLNNDNSISLVLEYDPCCSLSTIIPSSSDPRDLKKGMKIYYGGIFFTDAKEEAQLENLFKYQDYQSIVRLYQDIFLVLDKNTSKWCLVKILVP